MIKFNFGLFAYRGFIFLFILRIVTEEPVGNWGAIFALCVSFASVGIRSEE